MSSYTEGQTHQLVDRLEAERFTPADLTKLGQFANLGGIRAVVNGRAEIIPIKPRLLEREAMIKVAGAEKFVAADHFVIGKDGIIFLGGNFQKMFLGKVETDVQPATIRIHRLAEASLDDPIRAELGSDREEIALAHFWTVFKKRSTSADWFFAHICGTDGDIWAVHAGTFDGKDWSIEAFSVKFPLSWSSDGLVLSR